METKLYVGNLPYTTTEDDLKTLFEQAGSVTAVDLIKDRDTGSSKGFAFVTMGSQSELESVSPASLRRALARPREERSDSGGYGGRSSYGNRSSGGQGGSNRGGGSRRSGGSSGGQRRY